MMSEAPQESAETAGLRYVADNAPGIRRIRSGRGFRYVDTHGSPVRDDPTVERIRQLRIPPAWTDVWICPSPNGHLQATGRDARGRKQYRYHDRWRECRDASKFDSLAAFGAALPGIREQVDRDLRASGLSREKVLAAAIRLLESSSMRIGNEVYAQENGSFGLTTLRDRHVAIDGSLLRFHYPGKSGKVHQIAITDRRLARIVRQSRDLPGQLLFQYVDDDGNICPIESTDVNNYLKSITGRDFTAKDFRTWSATVLAAEEFATLDLPASAAQLERAIAGVVDKVAAVLGNTRAVCRASYIHPGIVAAFENGTLHELAKRSRRWSEAGPNEPSTSERLVLELLSSSNCG